MKRLAAGAFVLALAALPAAARADLFSSVSYGAHIATSGAGITLEKPILYDFSLRITTNNLSVSQQLSYDTTRYESTNHYQNVGIIGDFRPYGGRYRISAGLLFGNDRIINVAQPQGAQLVVPPLLCRWQNVFVHVLIIPCLRSLRSRRVVVVYEISVSSGPGKKETRIETDG